MTPREKIQRRDLFFVTLKRVKSKDFIILNLKKKTTQTTKIYLQRIQQLMAKL